MLGIGISTYNRKELSLRCLEAVLKYSPKDALIAISDDGSTDGTPQSLITWVSNSKDTEERVSVLGRKEHRGISASKKALTDCLLAVPEVEDIILLEDDVIPQVANWSNCWIETARENQQAHLLYLPGARYGRVLSVTGNDPTRIEWKVYCSGLVMYFRSELLKEIGSFNEKFTNYGWEHNELTARALLAQGQKPDGLYPHCVRAQETNSLLALDIDEAKRDYYEVAQYNKQASAKMQTASNNRPLYDNLIRGMRERFKTPQFVDRSKYFTAQVSR